MNSINTFLLSVFDRNGRYGQDISSLHRRYQNLSLIYVNLGFTSLVILFNSFNVVYDKDPNHIVTLLLCSALSFVSLALLKAKHPTASSFVILIEIHTANFITSHIFNCPLICLLGSVLYLCFVFSLTTSIYIHILNFVICLIEHYCDETLLFEVYSFTLTYDQKRQIEVLFPTALSCVFVIGLIMIFQKDVENDIWRIAKENYLKSENLTQELVQAMEAKDSFVSMLSHEIRNPLNALKGSIDYLSHVIKSPECSQVLKNARTSGDILLNLVNNVLDAAKFKSDKMEI
ncbi:MAG: histidine kinase dimerization/phospho-acceptor domain-containing protein, partial [Ignavibacteriaceae bacterium]|nr:histidine kinase dimerization/phospho-acceptor domain-containing protein [Ignavibacteriaceae bacterium]